MPTAYQSLYTQIGQLSRRSLHNVIRDVHSVMTANRDLADAAAAAAERAPVASTRRRAYACAAIALRAARTIAGARRILEAECPASIRADALDALDALAGEAAACDEHHAARPVLAERLAQLSTQREASW